MANGLTINGNFDTSQVGSVEIGGNLNGLTITGALIGQGDVNAPDLTVGLNLNNLTVLGFVPNEGGITNATIVVGKNLVGLNVPHGIFNSFITVGVLIDGGTTIPPGGGNIGPDGPTAVLDSTIRAGVQIRNLLINGDVVSDQPSNRAGKPTRIVAGEVRVVEGDQTTWLVRSGGSIDNFQITGALIDAVVAASVAPSGGNGALSTESQCEDVPGTFFDAPTGYLTSGTVGTPVKIAHFTPESYNAFGQQVDQSGNPVSSPDDLNNPDFYFYGTANPQECMLSGSINASFAPTPLSSNADATTPIPLPSKSTVLGGVIDTNSTSNDFDHAGLFAADTRGVLVGALPK